MKDYYAILGVPKTASQATIRDAYRRLAKQYHPDVNRSVDSEQIFKEINEAYEVLGDPESRSNYDTPTYFATDTAAPSEPKHRDPAYRKRRPQPFQESSSQRLNRLKEEYKMPFQWICRIGLVLTLLIGMDVIIPSTFSEEEIIKSQYYRGTSRSAAYFTISTDRGRDFTLYPNDISGFSWDVHSIVTLQISPIFSNILSIKSKASATAFWTARIYTRFVFFPVILLIASAFGILMKSNADAVINCGTISLIMGLICLFFMN